MLLKRNNVERVVENPEKAESMIKEGYTAVEAKVLPKKAIQKRRNLLTP